MLGYMTEKKAIEVGFTHHGKCFGIPIWITDEDCPMVAAKFAPFEILITFSQIIEGILHSIFWPDDDPVFQFQVGEKI